MVGRCNVKSRRIICSPAGHRLCVGVQHCSVAAECAILAGALTAAANSDVCSATRAVISQRDNAEVCLFDSLTQRRRTLAGQRVDTRVVQPLTRTSVAIPRAATDGTLLLSGASLQLPRETINRTAVI